MIHLSLITDGNIMIGGATLVPPGESIYNLGAMFLVEGPLTLSKQQMVVDNTTEQVPIN